MLTIKVEPKEVFNERSLEFDSIPGAELHLEHSLISLSKWESKWKKRYLTYDEKETHTIEEILDYISCMSTDRKPIDPKVIKNLEPEVIKKVLDYIADPHTATKIYDMRQNQNSRPEKLSSELIYYYMIYYGIPWEAEKWHLNNLMMLIRICNIKGGTAQNQMDMNAIFSQNKRLNAMRRPR